MLNRCVAIHYHAQVMVKERAAFGYYFHTEFPCGFYHHLVLLTPGLIIAFNAECAKGFCSAQGTFCIIQRIYYGFKIAISPIQNGTGAEYPWTNHQAGFYQFALCKNHFAVG